MIDAIYVAVLYVFKIRSKMPMSTTWGLLGQPRRPVRLGESVTGLGLAVSLLVAVATNPVFRSAFLP